MTISKGCQLLLSNTGQTATATRSGLYSMKSLHVADGGIVTSLPEVGAQIMQYDIGDLHIFGGGLMHSIWMGISAVNLTVDDLGILRGNPYDARFVYFEVCDNAKLFIQK